MTREEHAKVSEPWAVTATDLGTWMVGPLGEDPRAVGLFLNDAEFVIEVVNKGLAMQRYVMASLERADMMFEARRKMDQGANRISEDKPK